MKEMVESSPENEACILYITISLSQEATIIVTIPRSSHFHSQMTSPCTVSHYNKLKPLVLQDVFRLIIVRNILIRFMQLILFFNLKFRLVT